MTPASTTGSRVERRGRGDEEGVRRRRTGARTRDLATEERGRREKTRGVFAPIFFRRKMRRSVGDGDDALDRGRSRGGDDATRTPATTSRAASRRRERERDGNDANDARASDASRARRRTRAASVRSRRQIDRSRSIAARRAERGERAPRRTSRVARSRRERRSPVCRERRRNSDRRRRVLSLTRSRCALCRRPATRDRTERVAFPAEVDHRWAVIARERSGSIERDDGRVLQFQVPSARGRSCLSK